MERRGGFDQTAIDEGMQALAQAEGAKELYAAIRAKPVLRSPVFHAHLRQYRLQFEQLPGATPEAYDGFMFRYDLFFTLLHNDAYLEAAEKAAPSPQLTAPTAETSPLAPDLYLAAMSLLGTSLPAIKGPTYDPTRDKAALAEELSSLLGKPCRLPDFKPMAGTLWGLHRVHCLQCGTPRLHLHAYSLDLCTVPDLIEPFRQGRINGGVCSQCQSPRVFPERALLRQHPAPLDPLGSVSCLVRVSSSENMYMPPPGTTRDADQDRILEVRMDMLARQLSSDPLHDSRGAGIFTDGVAYNLCEALRRIEDTRRQGTASTQYLDICQLLTERLASGLLPYRDAEAYVRDAIAPYAQAWPLMIAVGGDPLESLARNLVFDACVQARDAPPSVRVDASCRVARDYTVLGETALAEMALKRAEMFAEMAPSDAMVECTQLLDATRESLYNAQGRLDEARAARERVLKALESSGGEGQFNLAIEQLAVNEALDLQQSGHFADAIDFMEASLERFSAQAEQIRAEDPAAAAEAEQGLSASKANLGGLWLAVSELQMHFQFIRSHFAEGTDLPDATTQYLRRLGNATAYMARQEELLQRLHPLLDERFLQGWTVESLRDHAESLLREAIEISGSLGLFEYLGIQSRTLAKLLRQANRDAEAAEAIAQASQFAARARDYSTLRAAFWEMAQDHQASGAYVEALDCLRNCLRAEMRLIVQGRREGTNFNYIVAEALRVADHVPDIMEAILIAESAKKLTAAVSLSRGVPLAAADAGAALPEQLQHLLAERETLRLQDLESPAARSDIAQALAENGRALVAARNDLAVSDPRYARWHDATNIEVSDRVTLERHLRALGLRTTFLGFAIEDGSAWAYAAWAEGQLLARCDISDAARSALQAGSDAQDLGEALQVVGELMSKMNDRVSSMHPGDLLIVSPCDELDRFPFALTPVVGRPLCTLVTVSTVQGIGMLDVLASRPPLERRAALCMGAPSRPDRVALEGANTEARAIADLLEANGTRAAPPLLDGDATVAHLIQRAPVSDLIHIACHADAPSSNRADGCLLLAVDALANDSGALESARIVNEVRIKRGAHVNLAACSSAAIGVAQRFLNYGLLHAFLVAGAGSVLGTLWPVGDEAALAFQTAYYGHLLAGKGPAAALAATQRDAIARAPNLDQLSASDWGAYVLYGV
jgi:hypothetical protein